MLCGLALVAFFFPFSGAVNLARGRQTAQSSTRAGGGESSRAVDGVLEAHWSSGSCTHTAPEGEPSPWWYVDLGRAHAIGVVRVLNRFEAPERLVNWQVRVGWGDAWTATACAPVQTHPVQAGAWAEVDCRGLRGQRVAVVLIGNPLAVLTLCEVQVFEHGFGGLPPGQESSPHLTAARREVFAYYGPNPGVEHLEEASRLLGESLNDLSTAALHQLYLDVSSMRGPRGEFVMTTPPFLALRARILERQALSSACASSSPGSQLCCSSSLTHTAAGCLAKAISFAKMAGNLTHAVQMFELGVSPQPAGYPLARWPDFWQTCELFAPALTHTSFDPFLDPETPSLKSLVGVLESSLPSVRADLDQVLSQFGVSAFEPAFPHLVVEGGWDRLVLYEGVRGWSSRWCLQATHPLNLCELLRGKLPGESHGLVSRYLTDRNEEVSISRMLPGSRLLVHNGGTNMRVNINLPLSDDEDMWLRVGRSPRRPLRDRRAAVYDACQDREMGHDGSTSTYWLEVGVMHPTAVQDLLRPEKSEL